MTRKPKDRLTLEKGLALAKERNMDEICVGQALALQYWMERLELNATQLGALRGCCHTSIGQVLRLEWSPTSSWWNVTAKALGIELWHFQLDAKMLLLGYAPVPYSIIAIITQLLAGLMSDGSRRVEG